MNDICSSSSNKERSTNIYDCTRQSSLHYNFESIKQISIEIFFNGVVKLQNPFPIDWLIGKSVVRLASVVFYKYVQYLHLMFTLFIRKVLLLIIRDD